MNNTGQLRNMTAIYLLCGDKILLLYRQGSKVVNDLWTGSAGGHFEEHELSDAKACILREMKEELSITEDMIENLALRYITLRRTNGEIRVNYYFFAKLPGGTEMDLVSDEGQLKWFPLEEVKALKMPLSAKHMIEHYLEVGRYDKMLYVGVADGEKGVFTKLPES